MLNKAADDDVEKEPEDDEAPDDDDFADPQFQQFCDDADLKTPARAAADLRRYGLADEIVDALMDRYEKYVGRVREIKIPHYMQSGNRITWYTGPRPTDSCWPPLHRALQERLGDDAAGKVDDSTTRIVSLLDHPATERFTTKGLVVGHVQSGKTTNYTGVIAKAVDRGYRLVIVLAGIHNELRRQTQTRLMRDLVRINPELWHPLTDPEKDFHPPIGAPAYFAKYSEQKVLCVVKKNAVVLRKLIAWLKEASAQLERVPALVIDDEADQAAVATPTINPLILELLDVLPRVAYVGYTATPFANLLIDPSSGNLYPEHFIVDLPKPDNHHGTETIFGRDPLDGEDPGDFDDGALDMVRIVPPEEVALVRPASNKEVDGFVPSVVGELRRAILYFWLATAARRVRGSGVSHSTMLVHTSLRVAVHEAFRKPIEVFRESVREQVVGGDERLLTELRELWDTETHRVPAAEMGEVPVSFDELRRHLVDVLDASRVILDNSQSEDRLDYSGDPVVAIAVGGNTLSRGLTLEGLVVSYFVRSASAYDTLLQMGRWFGYRDGYSDLPRIWMTDELRGWFRHLAGVEAEIRQDIDRYMREHETPMTFGVRIRAHPALAITAAAKMQDAVEVGAAYGGLRVQTHYFDTQDDGWLTKNQEAARALVAAIGGASTATWPDHFTGALWRDVDAGHIIDFLSAYDVHPKAADSDTEPMTRYIHRRNEKGKLLKWNVAIIGSARAGRGTFDFGSGVEVPLNIRAKRDDTPPDAADIKTLMSPRDAAVDLEDLPSGQRLTEAEIRKMRFEALPDSGLLTIYPIDRVSPTRRKGRAPLDAVLDPIGIGIVFPQPPPGQDEIVYYQADLSRVQERRDDYLEEEDQALLDDEQL